ncbi:hypothetical protein FMIA91_01650 [Fidelibacter multiformis]
MGTGKTCQGLWDRKQFFKPGKYNAITEVPGVKIGHTTLYSGDDIRTYLNTIQSATKNSFRRKTRNYLYQ